jgi:hypothetical protein
MHLLFQWKSKDVVISVISFLKKIDRNYQVNYWPKLTQLMRAIRWDHILRMCSPMHRKIFLIFLYKNILSSNVGVAGKERLCQMGRVSVGER